MPQASDSSVFCLLSSDFWFYGGHSKEDPPVPIPNTEVKLFSADGTAWATMWESRSPPIFLQIPYRATGKGFFFALLFFPFPSPATSFFILFSVNRGLLFKITRLELLNWQIFLLSITVNTLIVWKNILLSTTGPWQPFHKMDIGRNDATALRLEPLSGSP